MKIDISTSVRIVWMIANAEASAAGSDTIQPVHFFLGVLKIIDPKFAENLKDLELPDDEKQSIFKDAKNVRRYLEIQDDDVTKYRRKVRASLKRKETRKADNQMLHRSEVSRHVFEVAVEKAVKAGQPKVSLSYLIEALFETGAVQFR